MSIYLYTASTNINTVLHLPIHRPPLLLLLLLQLLLVSLQMLSCVPLLYQSNSVLSSLLQCNWMNEHADHYQAS